MSPVSEILFKESVLGWGEGMTYSHNLTL